MYPKNAPSRLPSRKPAITSAAVTPVWVISPLTASMRKNSSTTEDSGGMMKMGIPRMPGPHCHAAKTTSSKTTLTAVPLRASEEPPFTAMLLPRTVRRH
jgi:hypothetical protein